MADIQYVAAEIRREKEKIETKNKPQGKNIMDCPIPYGGHNNWNINHINLQVICPFSKSLTYSLWSPYVTGQTIIFLPPVVSSSSFFFPRLISANADWMSAILPHMLWPKCEFKMQVWNVLHAARWKYRMQKSRQKSPSGHHRTILSGYIFATKARINNWKKNLLNSNTSLHVPTIWWTSAH